MGENIILNQAKKESFCRLFPTLKGLLPHAKDIRSITHGGNMDLKLATRRLQCKPGSFFSRTKYESLYVLNGDGLVMAEVGVVSRFKLLFWPIYAFDKTDTLESCVFRLGINGREVRFILSVFDGIIVIYEVPKEETFLGAVMRERHGNTIILRELRRAQQTLA